MRRGPSLASIGEHFRRSRPNGADRPNKSIAILGHSLLYVNTEKCTSCTACYQPDACPVGAIYAEEVVLAAPSKWKYDAEDQKQGHAHTFFIQLSRDVFAD